MIIIDDKLLYSEIEADYSGFDVLYCITKYITADGLLHRLTMMYPFNTKENLDTDNYIKGLNVIMISSTIGSLFKNIDISINIYSYKASINKDAIMNKLNYDYINTMFKYNRNLKNWNNIFRYITVEGCVSSIIDKDKSGISIIFKPNKLLKTAKGISL